MANPLFQIRLALLLPGRSSEDKSERLLAEARGRPSPHERSRPALWPTHSSTNLYLWYFPRKNVAVAEGWGL